MPTIAPDRGRLVVRSPEPLVYAAPIGSGVEPAVWTCGIYDRDGGLIYDLTGIATVGPVIQRLNEWDSTDVTIPKSATAALGAYRKWSRELHVYRNGVLEFAGPFDGGFRARGSDGGRQKSASGLERYFMIRTRFLPQAEENNLLKNPDFTRDWSDWTRTGAPTLDATLSETASQSAELVDGDRIRQGLYFTDFLRGASYVLRLLVRVWVSADADPGPVCTLYDNSVLGAERSAVGYVTADTPREVWTSISVDLRSPYIAPNVTQFIAEGRWDGAGTVNFDHLNLGVVALDDVLADLYDDVAPLPGPPPIDLVQIGRNMVRENRDLNIGFSAEGFAQILANDAGAPKLVWEWLHQVTDGGTIDIGIEASRYVRTFRMWPNRRGRHIDSDEVTLCPSWVEGLDRNCIDYEWSGNAGGVSDLTVTGPDGMIGRAIRPDRFDGFKVQDVRAAPSGYTSTDQLDTYANGEIDRQPQEPPLILEGIRGGLIDTVRLGDRVRAVVVDCDVDIDRWWRVTERRLLPSTGRWDATLTWEPDP